MSAYSVTIPIGATVSPAIPINQYVVGMYVPTIGASVVYLQASQDGVAGWARVLKSDGSADWNVASSTGDRWIFLDQLAPFAFLRVELSAIQAAIRTFIFVQKPNMEGSA